jgi:flagellar protein FlgJ
MFSSEAGKTFQGMLDVEVARSSSTGISLGLAEAIVTQLGAGLSDQVK